MSSWKAKQPRVRDMCWICDRKLYAGGRSYRKIEIDGVMRPVHAGCIDAEKRAREDELLKISETSNQDFDDT